MLRFRPSSINESGLAMPSFDLSRDELVFLLVVLALVVLPSRLSWLGNLVGRAVRGAPRA